MTRLFQKNIASSQEQLNFIKSMTQKYSVSEEFINLAMPAIDTIFNEIPEELKESMLELTEESFVRQADIELINARSKESAFETSTTRRHKTVSTARTTDKYNASTSKAC